MLSSRRPVMCVLPVRMRKTLGHRADRLIGGFRAGVLRGKRRLVVPGHPVGGVRGDRVGMALECHQILKRGHVVQFGGVDQAHERIADMGAVEGTGEERVLAVQDGLFQNPFGLLSMGTHGCSTNTVKPDQ